MILHATGDRLKELRLEYGYTFKEMTKEACIDRDNYMRVERGERNSFIGLFCNIVSGLNIKVSDIFNEEYKKRLTKYDDIDFLRKILSSDEHKLIKKRKIINMLKKYRAKRGISQSILASELGVSIQTIDNVRANDMAQMGYASHYRPDGTAFDYFWVDVAYEIVSGGKDVFGGSYGFLPEAVDNSFINSPGHRAPIIDSDNKYMAV